MSFFHGLTLLNNQGYIADIWQVCRDISKPFEMFSYEILVKEIEKYGLVLKQIDLKRVEWFYSKVVQLIII